jgi:PKD repeat protein
MLLSGLSASAQPPCVSSFTAAAAPLNNQLLRVQFTNNSSWGLSAPGIIRQAIIDYGDGNSASIGTTSPSHVYATTGSKIVGLRINRYDSATNTLLCTDTFGLVITVAYPSCGTTMAVSGTGLTRTFTATTPTGGTGMNYSWNFGDGSPASSGFLVSHSYATSGTYTVTLTATRGTPVTCTYINTMAVTVYVPPAPINCSPLHGGFTSSVSANVVTTTNTSSSISSPYSVDYLWRYGDGATSTAKNPLPHTYTAKGIYILSLVTTWHDSLYTTTCRDSVSDTIGITSIPAPPNVISGTVYYDSVTYGISNFKVWLIKLDTATHMLYAVDSVVTASTAFPFYAFGSKPAGSYRTKAAVYSSALPSAMVGLIPTYHDTSSYWSSARVINHAGGVTTGRHIFMNSGILPSGPGFIGGNVSLGANKGSGNGVGGILIILRGLNLKIVQATYTDANGNYSFPNIPIGFYSVYPEFINYTTQPVTPVVVTANTPTWTAINFNQDDQKRSIAPRSLAVTTLSTSAGFTVAPNPADGIVRISWKASSPVNGQFIISNITGAQVTQTEMVQGAEGRIDLNVAQLPAGMYFVRGTGGLSAQVIRLIVR